MPAATSRCCRRGSLQGTQCRVPRGAATFPHRLPLRFIPPAALRLRAPPIHEDMVVHGLCGRVTDSARNACSLNCCCSDRRKSVGPSAPIAYVTSVSPPNEAAAWPGRMCWVPDEAAASQGCRCWVANAAIGCPRRSSCKSPRARILVLGTSGAHWSARWPRFELTERVAKS